MDAAAVMQFMLNVVQPQSTGIGGGCFVVIFNASTGQVSTLDGREEAPSAMHENSFCADPACAQVYFLLPCVSFSPAVDLLCGCRMLLKVHTAHGTYY